MHCHWTKLAPIRIEIKTVTNLMIIMALTITHFLISVKRILALDMIKLHDAIEIFFYQHTLDMIIVCQHAVIDAVINEI